MSPKISRLALFSVLLVLVAATSAWADPPLDKPHVPDEVIIKFKANASQQQKDLILTDLGAVQKKHLGRIKSDLKKLGSASVEDAVGRYKNHPAVEFIEPNYLLEALEVPADPRYPELWGMNNTGQTGGTPGADISAEMAWDVYTGNPNIVVGVIDTGVDYNHPDLVDNMWTNPGEIPDNGVDDDGNGYIDDIHGWDFYNDDNDPMDDNSHGTHCSGTIGGVGSNAIGVTGVNWHVRIMALKFLSGGGSGTTDDAVDALEYATDMAMRYPGTIRLTSNSWGGGGFSEALRQAIEDAGNAEMLFVAAAGNSSANTDVSPHYPSSYDLDCIVAVAATDHNDQLASFSSYGATTVDLAAPGVDILSTIPGNAYGLKSGTSMATPHTAGVCALTFGRFPAISALDAKSLVLNGVDPLDNLTGIVLTGGRLNAFWPIAEPDSIPPDPVDDLAIIQAGSNWLDATWTATGDDGSDGTASRYDMRYSTSPITEMNFTSASMANGEPDPGPPGTLESMRINGLDFDTTYYVAVRVLDEFGNPSLISNVPSGTTLGAPDIASTPTSMSEVLLTGASSMQQLTLSNVGFGTLDYVIPTPTLLGEAVTIHEYERFEKYEVDPRPGLPQVNAVGGPDNFGYRWADSNDAFGPAYDWVDISGIGNVAISSGDDVNDGPFPIGFDFPYYGGDYATFRVCSNGFLSLTSSSTAYSNGPLPSAGAPAHMIAPFWDDLNLTSGAIYYYNDGSRLIVQWDSIPHYGSGGPYTFQAILYPDGTIVYQYESIGSPDNSATVGWQNGPGTDGLSVVYNSAYVEDGLAIEIRAIPQWLTVAPTEGTIYAPNSEQLTVTFDATGLLGGTYDGIIRIVSNDPDESEYEVPAQLVVIGAPDIEVEPLAFDFGALFIGATGETDIAVRNIGTDVLTVSSMSVDNPIFTLDQSGVSIPPRGTVLLHVSFDPTAATPYSGTITIQSDDPDEPTVNVSLSGAGLVPPDFSADPTSFTSNLFTGETETQVMTLSNSGGADFEFDLSIDFHADVTVDTAPDLGKGEVDTRVGAPVIENQGGPDNFGYLWIDSDEPGGPTFDWVDITGVGTPIFSGNADDVNMGPFPIGFDFPFYENSFSTFRVSSNGFISFTSTLSDLSNSLLPGTGSPENLLAVLHDDMYVDADIPSQVYYHNDGGRLIVQFHNIRRYGQSDSSPPFYDVEAILYPNGTIVYQYNTVETGGNTGCTIGIQNEARDDGLTIVYNNDYVHDGLAIRIAAFPEWLTVSPGSGVVPPGGSLPVDVGFNADGLFGGAYEADIVINSNDPQVPTLAVPVTMNVTGAPQILLSATSIDFGSQYVGYPVPRELLISNVGTDQLIILGWSNNNPAFSHNLTVPTFLGPTQSVLVDMSFLPSSATTFDGIFTIASNDPNQPNVQVDLTGVGLIAPIASVSPTSLSSDLFTGEMESQQVTLTNSGGSDLDFQINPQLSLEGVVKYDLPFEIEKGEDYGVPGILGTGGPDNYGYSWIDSDEPGGPVFDWVDITGVGTAIYSGNADDSNQGPFPIGFDFPFYENTFSEFRVSSNGFITFTSTSSDLSNAPLPGTGAPENLLAVFHDDMYVDADIPSQVYYHNDGSRLIVQFHNIRRYNQSDTSPPFYDIEAILSPNGTIVYQYLTVASSGNTSATIGIQNAARDDGLTVVYNDDYVHDNMAIRIGTVPDWLTSNPTSGTVPPGGSQMINVTFDATGLFGGDYDGALNIETNDPGPGGLLNVAAHLHVTGIPLFAVDPASLDFGDVYLSLSNTLPVTVSNPGTQTLHVTGASLSDADYSIDLGAFDLEPLQSQVVNVTFEPTTAGVHNATLSFTHDAAGSPGVVSLTGTGVVPPEIAWSPSEIVGAALPGASKTKTLTICNEGGSDLTYNLGATETMSTASVTVHHQGGELPKETEDTQPGILGSGGPDAFGYTWVDSDDPGGPMYDFVDISGIGTPIFGVYEDDDNYGPFPIGFDFSFYGQAFNEFNVCSNGWISFTNGTLTTYTNQPLPNDSSSTPENMLAVFWDDMVNDPSDGNECFYYNDGTRLIVQFEVRRIATFNPPYYSFQAILYPNGDIVYQYRQLGTTTNSATVGIQNGTKDDGLTVVYNDTYVHEDLAILFSSGAAWLSASPESGVIPAGECVDVDVTMNAAELEAGDYYGSINIASNDLTDPLVEVPVTFHVGSIDATAMDCDPNTVNVTANGKFMTVYVELPVGYDPADVLIETVEMNGVPAALSPYSYDGDFNNNGIPDLMFKFDRSEMEDHMPEGDSVEMMVIGEVEDTTWFVATDYIRVINPTMTTLTGGEVIPALSTQAITWDDPQGWNVQYADLFWTADDGLNWQEIARNVQGNSYAWNVPIQYTQQARVRVFVYDNAGLMGFDTSEQVFEVSQQVTAVDPIIPKVHSLAQNAPNPFNPKTVIHYDLPRDERVNITIYDVKGRVVKTLVSDTKPAGSYEVTWVGDDNQGNRVSSGVYFYRIIAGDFQASRRMLLVK